MIGNDFRGGRDEEANANGPHMATQCTLPVKPKMKGASNSVGSNMEVGVASAAPTPRRCIHCQNPTLSDSDYCCNGCRHAHLLVSTAEGHIEAQTDGSAEEIDCRLQGLHCSACVSVIESLFLTVPGATGITINPALGQAKLLVERGEFELASFAAL